ncbi:MAG: SMR family transporter [Novosphingobium sp.]|nr:SMR family transporter [Novosphingobium sp.]
MFEQIPLRAVTMVALVTVTQVIGASMLVKTMGFRDPMWTMACLAVYVVSFYLLAETIRQGMALSLIMPILAALVPLATIAVAVILFQEQASWLRIGLLSGACVLIGVASTV